MLFSIIIPTYNRRELIGRTLNSVLEQDYRPLQLILVDNNSEDNTLESLNEFKEKNEASDFIIEVTTEKQHGASIARNTGAKLAKGEWLIFFDSDDVMQPSLISSYYNAIATSPEDTKLIYTKARNIQLNGSAITLPFRKGDLVVNQILHCILSTQRYTIRHDAYNTLGGWDESISRWIDWELGIRVALRYTGQAIPLDVEPLIYIYSQEDSITGTSFAKQHQTLEKALDIVEQDIRNSDISNKDKVILYVEHRRIVLAAEYYKEGYKELAEKLYNSTYMRCKHIWQLRIAFPYLFWHVRMGFRGSATIIRLILG